MEIEFSGLDLEKWKRLVKKVQVENFIYPGRSATDADYNKFADLLDNLFTENFKKVSGFRNDLYLLARTFCLQFDPARDDNATYFEPYVGLGPGDHFSFLEFTEFTRRCLGLTEKKLSDIPNGMDIETVVKFFDLLFRNFNVDGFLPIVRGLLDEFGNPESMTPFNFNVKCGFNGMAEFLLNDIKSFKHPNEPFYGFCKFLLTSPMTEEEAIDVYQPSIVKRIIGTPCLWVDIDENRIDAEDTLDRYKIWPSIRVKTSPRGAHWYWVLRTPASRFQIWSILNSQVKLAKLLGGDLERTNIGAPSRLPGCFNFRYAIPHFISCEFFEYEYDLSDFSGLPYSFLSLALEIWIKSFFGQKG